MPGRRASGEGSIYVRADGRWAATLSLKDSSGKSKRVTTYCRSQRDAKAALKDLLRQRDDGVQLGTPSQTLGQYLGGWLAATVKPAVRTKTFEGVESIVRVRIVPRLGGTKLRDLTAMQVAQLYADLAENGLAPRSIRHTHAVLRRALDQAVAFGLVARNPAAVVTPPRAQRRELRVLSGVEAAAFLDASRPHRDHAIYVLALSTGLRQGELLGLKWADVDFDGKRLTVQRSLQRQREAGLTFTQPKTSRSRRVVMLSQRAVASLRQHKANQNRERHQASDRWRADDLVFCGQLGEPLDPSRVTARFKAALAAAGLPPMRFHDLRHSAATLLLSQNVHPKVVSEMLGHATITITLDTYSHMVPALHEGAADAMDAILGA